MQNDKKCCENYDKIFNLRMLPEMEKMVSGGVRRHSKNRFNSQVQPTSFYPTCRHMIILFPKSLILQGGSPRNSQHRPFNQIRHFHPNLDSILSSLSLFFSHLISIFEQNRWEGMMPTTTTSHPVWSWPPLICQIRFSYCYIVSNDLISSSDSNTSFCFSNFHTIFLPQKSDKNIAARPKTGWEQKRSWS